jgi:hypothetical protein
VEHDPSGQARGHAFRKTGIHPRIKSEGRLFPDHALGDFPPQPLFATRLHRSAEFIEQPLPEGFHILALKIRIMVTSQ